VCCGQSRRAEAKGKDKVAEAELEAQYKSSKKATYEVSVIRAEADYAVAREKCDDKAGNDKDVYVKEAKALGSRQSRRQSSDEDLGSQCDSQRRRPLMPVQKRKKRAVRHATMQRLLNATPTTKWKSKSATNFPATQKTNVLRMPKHNSASK
jgi:hypothetical protein